MWNPKYMNTPPATCYLHALTVNSTEKMFTG